MACKEQNPAMPVIQFGAFLEVDFEVLEWDTISATVSFVVPTIFPGAGKYPIDTVKLSPTHLDWHTSQTFAVVGTGFTVSVGLLLDGANAAVTIDAVVNATAGGVTVRGFPVHVHEGWSYPWPKAPVRAIGTARVAHVVVVMLENRSFDSLLGWLYTDKGNRPVHNIPAQSNPTFDGLEPNTYWTSAERSDVGAPDASVPEDRRIYTTERAASFGVPDPDPFEQFLHMNYQLFGAETPGHGTPATMKGFAADYAAASPANAAGVMECYAPDQVPVLTALAKNYAVCDRWFASVPCQTWPNRAFVHSGTSCGRVNNLDAMTDSNELPNPKYYETKTIFNVLNDVGVTWKVYSDSPLPTLTRTQFVTQLANPLLIGHFRGFGEFKNDAAHGVLPSYSFVEPDFMIAKNDYHPPHDVSNGERFLFDVWTAISTSPAWQNTLLVITFDEHGGCYDHVAPPWTATKPDDCATQTYGSLSRTYDFAFERYGVRVPAIVVSPWIEAGTVFRSASTAVEYDHTSILATLRDWQDLSTRAKSGWLASKRIAAAPTLAAVCTRPSPRTDLPSVPRPHSPQEATPGAATSLNPNQRAVLAAHLTEVMPGEPSEAKTTAVAAIVATLRTEDEAVALVHGSLAGTA
jgi:phospholipase C